MTKIAILFFGLSKCLSKIIPSIKKHLFDVLSKNKIEYDIFIHTNKIIGRYTNRWSREDFSNYPNEDIESILSPKYYLYDNQDDIIKKINIDEYTKNPGNWCGKFSIELTKILIKNMFLALYSKKRITEEFEKHKNEYDYAIITRPDSMFFKDINIDWFKELNNNNIIIPSIDWYTGCNDRFCIGKPDVILYYGTLFNHLEKYLKTKKLCSEKYLLDMLNEKKINIIKKDIVYKKIRMSKNDTIKINGITLPDDFVPEIYKLLNKDLTKMNDNELINHYLNFGIKEKRIYKITLPDDFVPEIYKLLNKDLTKMNDNELINHYLNFGIKEKRLYKITLPNDFNPTIYRLLYGDLSKLNDNELKKHYFTHGIKEKRLYKK